MAGAETLLSHVSGAGHTGHGESPQQGVVYEAATGRGAIGFTGDAGSHFAIEAQRNEGKKPADAIFEACLARFRPIMMTTMAVLMASLPIALGLGPGGLARWPLGLAVVGGLLVSQMLTLYITPVISIYFDAPLFRNRGLPRRTQLAGVVSDGVAACACAAA